MDYYNNQTPTENGNHYDAFSIAAIVCGIISIITCCTGFLSIIAGSLGILFAVLTRRTGRPMSSMSIVGICSSCIGLILGIVMIIYALVITAEQSPEYYEQIYEQIYGDDYDDILSDYYNYYS